MDIEVFNDIILPKILKNCREDVPEFLSTGGVIPGLTLNMDFSTGKILFNMQDGSPIIYKDIITNDLNNDKLIQTILDDYISTELMLPSKSRKFINALGKITREADEKENS